MGRISANDVSKYKTSDSEWFRLENDGDFERVQLMYESIEDTDVFSCHKVVVGYEKNGEKIEKYVDCLRDSYDEPIDKCPFCEAGLKIQAVPILSMYSHKDKKVKIWERSANFFEKKIVPLFNRYGNVSKKVFDIERHGAKGDKKTTYDFIAMSSDDGVHPVDLTNIERPSFDGIVLKKTKEEMNIFLDSGRFPDTDAGESVAETTRSAEPEVRRRSSRRGEVE